MGIISAILKNPEDLTHLLKLKMASVAANRAIPADPNLAFCYQMLGRVTRSFSIVIQELEPGLRNAVSTVFEQLPMFSSISRTFIIKREELEGMNRCEPLTSNIHTFSV